MHFNTIFNIKPLYKNAIVQPNAKEITSIFYYGIINKEIKNKLINVVFFKYIE